MDLMAEVCFKVVVNCSAPGLLAPFVLQGHGKWSVGLVYLPRVMAFEMKYPGTLEKVRSGRSLCGRPSVQVKRPARPIGAMPNSVSF